MFNNAVLYVDDEGINLDLFSINFTQEFNVYTAESPQKGLEIIKKQNIPVVITDFKMPDINGLEFVEMIKKDFPNVVCIMLSGFAESRVAKDSTHVFEYIMKPYKKDEMRSAIKSALSIFNSHTA
ncbi:MAG: response regulator [Bacteroidales bacterium]|jgi:YesN/AraC family two-component response regulator|nr:response regulator [Bacteroidales bacterium]